MAALAAIVGICIQILGYTAGSGAVRATAAGACCRSAVTGNALKA